MYDPDTFLTQLYVLIDDWDKAQPAPSPQPGPAAALSRSEVLTLAVFSQWAGFGSERAFWRYAQRHLRPLFPHLPGRSQFNRAVRRWHERLSALAVHLGQRLVPPDGRYEVLDATGVATRNAQRRGLGWLAGEAAVGRCTRLGWYEGVRLLLCTTPQGAITGYGAAPANVNDRRLAETFLAVRAHQEAPLASVGQPVSGWYLADGGFTGQRWEQHWATAYGALVVCPPERNHRRRWSPPWGTWLATHRQVIETVMDRLLSSFGLARERPHTLGGLLARLGARVALHNVCLWFNQQAARPLLAVADLVDW